MTENLDQIPESKLSRWAYRLALIPILGLPLYMILAIVAVVRIGSKGQTGFHLLRLGLFRMLRMTIVGVLAVGALWFCPKYVYNNLESNTISISYPISYLNMNMNINVIYDRGTGYIIRGLDGDWYEHGEWEYFNKGSIVAKGNYFFGNRVQKWEYKGIPTVPFVLFRDRLVCDGQINHTTNQKVGRWIFWKEKHRNYGEWKLIRKQENIIKEEFYDNNGNLIKTIEYKDGKPIN